MDIIFTKEKNGRWSASGKLSDGHFLYDLYSFPTQKEAEDSMALAISEHEKKLFTK